MFAFHKPRVYRSSEGCCICRAKSSSSRFTDSRKYENDSINCFNLKCPRFGEICNACVLLVKRYKRLPVGSTRHWGHVVDARACPTSKSVAKCKTHNGDTEHSSNSKSRQNGISFLPEKFSKIFKKNKNNKSSGMPKKESSSRRKSSSSHSKHNIPIPTPVDPALAIDTDSSRLNSAITATAVQFQTETRASSYRTRLNSSTNCMVNRKRSLNDSDGTVGSKRRKCLPPCKNRQTVIDSAQFFDEYEWQKRKSCCGIVYECTTFGGAFIVDIDQYKPCGIHRHQKKKEQAAIQMTLTSTPSLPQKPVLATIPTIMQLAPPAAPPMMHSNPTPALKKHHLFYKRQSECFPHSDVSVISINSNSSHTKTESSSAPAAIAISGNATAISTIQFPAVPASVNAGVNTVSGLTINATNTIASSHMPRHSSAKITTINPIPATTASAANRSQNFLNKMKSDTSKMVKNSLEKLNTAVRVKPSEPPNVKEVANIADKSYVLTRPTITAVSANHHYQYNYSQQQHHQQQQHQQQQQQTLTKAGPSAVPGCSASPSSSTSTKFSDNSSDSGFDENMQDRKSASPLQEDTDRKIYTRAGVQTMFLASGVQIQGQQQNLVLTGNEVAAKILQARRQHPSTSMHQQFTNNRTNSTLKAASNTGADGAAAGPSTSTSIGVGVKMTPIVNSPGASTSSHVKMRTIYNNNTIQHENGITTIVPACSIAATTQTAAMKALAPSTVTITPAPPHIINGNGRKLAAGCSGLPNQGTTIIGTHLNAINNNNSHNMNGNVSGLNQKIILVKTAPKYNNNHNTNINNGSCVPASITPIIPSTSAMAAMAMSMTTTPTAAALNNFRNPNQCKRTN